MKKPLLLLSFLLVVVFISWSVDHHRWPIKTTPKTRTHAHSTELNDVITMPDPPEVGTNDSRYESVRIPSFDNPAGLKEGDLLKVKGYMHLVAFEANDDEYHIQISNSKESGDNCLIVEVPDPKNTDDEALKAKYEAVRTFIREQILHGHEPGSAGNMIGGRAYVSVTGQLFFDASHTHNQVRGKKGMRSKTLWEIHPIIDMKFAQKP